MSDKIMPQEKEKTAKKENNALSELDEQALARVLEAAYVLQEHKGALPVGPRDKSSARAAESAAVNPATDPAPVVAGLAAEKHRGEKTAVAMNSSAACWPQISAPEISQPASMGRTPAPAASTPAAIPEKTVPGESSVLAFIAETQRQIHTRHLDLASAMDLVSGRAAEIAQASGAAIAVLDDHQVSYRSAVGAQALPRGAEIPEHNALCVSALRTGEITRCTDVTADPALDAESCRRRGIGSLIAIPIRRGGTVAAALEIYYAKAGAFTEADVHAAQLLAGLIAEALLREAQMASQKSLAAERASMLAALEKLQPNLAALVEAAPAKNPAEGSDAAKIAPAAPELSCRKCGHQMIAGEQFCGSCGTAHSTDYEAPNMQTKVATLWLMQQTGKHNAAAAAADGGGPRIEARATMPPAVPTLDRVAVPRAEARLEPFPAHASEPQTELTQPRDKTGLTEEHVPLPDLFEMPEIKKALAALEDAEGPVLPLPCAEARSVVAETNAISQPIAARAEMLSLPVSSPTSNINLEEQEDELARALAEDGTLTSAEEASAKKSDAKAEAEKDAAKNNTAIALTLVPANAKDAITWKSAAEARAVLERLAESSKQNGFLRFWNAHRGEIYLAIAVVLVGGVIRWAIWSHSANVNAAQTNSHHQKTDPNADLSLFDRMLIGLGLAEAPDRPPEYKGNPETQVWVDTHTALYYCPGAELYGKTPQGKLTTQRDAQLDQFEPASHQACE